MKVLRVSTPRPREAAAELSCSGTDAPGTEPKETIPINGDTTLVYVDLVPGGRFVHPTQCILISTEGAQVMKGEWPLVLNGKELFRDGKKYKVDFPVNLSGK